MALAIHIPNPVTAPAPQGAWPCTSGAALITHLAGLQIPFWPVPMTLHTCPIFLVASRFTLRPRLGRWLLWRATSGLARLGPGPFFRHPRTGHRP